MSVQINVDLDFCILTQNLRIPIPTSSFLGNGYGSVLYGLGIRFLSIGQDRDSWINMAIFFNEDQICLFVIITFIIIKSLEIAS